MKKAVLLAICGLMGGCIIQKRPPQQAEPQVTEDTGSEVEYKSWSGPGWYSGVYFTDREAHYRWRRERHPINPRPPGTPQHHGGYNRGRR